MVKLSCTVFMENAACISGRVSFVRGKHEIWSDASDTAKGILFVYVSSFGQGHLVRKSVRRWISWRKEWISTAANACARAEGNGRDWKSNVSEQQHSFHTPCFIGSVYCCLSAVNCACDGSLLRGRPSFSSVAAPLLAGLSPSAISRRR